jgi:hypothetical protein
MAGPHPEGSITEGAASVAGFVRAGICHAAAIVSCLISKNRID